VTSAGEITVLTVYRRRRPVYTWAKQLWCCKSCVAAAAAAALSVCVLQLGEAAAKVAPDVDGPPPAITSLKPLNRCSSSADLMVGQKVRGDGNTLLLLLLGALLLAVTGTVFVVQSSLAGVSEAFAMHHQACKPH